MVSQNPFSIFCQSCWMWRLSLYVKKKRSIKGHQYLQWAIWHFTCYREIQKATQNFTNTLGEGSFGTIYKAMMPTREVVAMKMLGPNSKQGEKEFQAEVFANNFLLRFLGYWKDLHKGLL